MNKHKKWLGFAVAIILTGAAGFIGWQVFAGPEAAAQVAEETAVVRRGTLQVTVEGTGSLSPHSEVALGFTTSGQVAQVLVEEDELVGPEHALVRLDTDDLKLEIVRAEAALDSAEAQLAELLAGPRVEEVAAQEANLQAMEGQVSAADVTRDQLTASPDAAQIAAAEAQVAAAERDYRVSLIAYDSTDKKDEDRKDQARYDLWAAEVALEAARTQLDVLLAGADADEVRAVQANVAAAAAQRDVARAQLDLLLAGAAEEDIEAAEAGVAQANVALEQARLRLKEATLTAPMAGSVTHVGVGVGEMVGPGQPVVVLSDLAVLEVEVNLDETDVAKVAVGQEARVSLDAFPGAELTGEVAHIAPVADVQAGVVLYPVTIRLVSGEAPVRAGMTAEVNIVAASAEDALIVPLRAIHTEGKQTSQYEGKRSGFYVERLVGDEIEQVEVALGLITDTEAEITSGLEAGDVVVVVPGPAQDSGTQLPPMSEAIRGGE